MQDVVPTRRNALSAVHTERFDRRLERFRLVPVRDFLFHTRGVAAAAVHAAHPIALNRRIRRIRDDGVGRYAQPFPIALVFCVRLEPVKVVRRRLLSCKRRKTVERGQHGSRREAQISERFVELAFQAPNWQG